MCLPNAKHVFKLEREWEHAGLQCAVVQGREGGNRCGYVRVPPGHKLHGRGYDDDVDVDVDVHGGLTFAKLEPCAHDDGVGWWFGFDCAHAGDASYEPGKEPQFIKDYMSNPALAYSSGYEHFWTHDEVVRETEKLATQLSAIQN